jgi:sigma-B regulation protein RsbU (phosphoserine phosphatase)
MDIDTIIRRSLIYASVTAMLAAIYLLLVFAAGNIMEFSFGARDNNILFFASILIIAFALDPLKQKAQNAIDRIFYQEKLNYQRALMEFGRELPLYLSEHEILSAVINTVGDTMHIRPVHCFIFPEYNNLAEAQEKGSIIGLLTESRIPHRVELLPNGKAMAGSYVFNDRDANLLHEQQTAVCVPMVIKNKVIGCLNSGPKLNGRAFSKDDLDLLISVAGQAAIAIENAHLRAIAFERQKIEEELSLARTIQQSLLPEGQAYFGGLHICGHSQPAESVGGDYFDYIYVSPTKMLIVVADVSGKGISAALYMSKVQGMMHMAAAQDASPRTVLNLVNKYLYSVLSRNAFITMSCALIDLEKQQITLCRAGHTPAFTGSHGKWSLCTPRGMGLGLVHSDFFAQTLEEIQIPIQPGSHLLLYTDGITETMNAQRQEYGQDKLMDFLNSCTAMDASHLHQEIMQDLVNFQADTEQHDDQTMVIISIPEEWQPVSAISVNTAL